MSNNHISHFGGMTLKLPRDRVSINEVMETDPGLLEKILEFYDVSPGEVFFIKDNPDKMYLIDDVLSSNDDVIAVFDRDKQIGFHKNCLPLYSIGAMIDHIEYYGRGIELRSYGPGWLLILDTEGIIESDEGEDLVAFLWRVVKQVSSEKALT